jgi:para-aminobenzoate synthetase component 1
MRKAARNRVLKSTGVLEIKLTADQLVAKLLYLSKTESVCLLDSCGVGHLGSHLLLAGVRPVEVVQLSGDRLDETLRILDEKLAGPQAGIFTLSYDLGLKLQGVSTTHRPASPEPPVFLALFDALLIHDYDTGRTFLAGSEEAREEIADLMRTTPELGRSDSPGSPPTVDSDFTKPEYLSSVETIREHIRAGDTYQTNLTQQISCSLAEAHHPQQIFLRLRRDHPAPFAAYLSRPDSTVVSASPERFFRIDRAGNIESSPIKGTRPRGNTIEDDTRLRNELESSEKDRAENAMIVDLMRNDLGRVCEFGSVKVEKLCDVEEHPTLFHLVSTVRGRLRQDVRFSAILRALFPCGSITGAPKISTMLIIDDIERSNRGLSMGAIGVYVPAEWDLDPLAFDTVFDVSVAIRTMVIRDGKAVFNVGGGIVIDSDPEKEFDESLLKAKALLNALGDGG